MKRMTRYFFQGVIFIAPIAVTVYIFYHLFELIDQPIQRVEMAAYKTHIPGVGFVTTVFAAVAGLTLFGFLTSNFLTRGAMRWFDQLLGRFPLVKLLHSSVKSLTAAFVGDKKRFNQPVLVNVIPGTDVKFVGFITRPTMEAWGLFGQVAVYIPAAFNFGGTLIVVPKEQVRPLDIPPADVMAFVISGGVLGEQKEAIAGYDTAIRAAE